MGSFLLLGGRIIDPSSGLDIVGDIHIVDGKIEQIGDITMPKSSDGELDFSGFAVVPGFIDVHVHFREPGFMHKEDIKSGSLAALAGGYTSVIQMPNTKPPLATPELVKKYTRSELIHAYVAAAITKDREGKEINDLRALAQAGAKAFSDDGSPVTDDSIMREALKLSKELGLRIMSHSENLALVNNGAIIKGEIADKLGVKGIDPDAESSMVERDIKLAKETGGNLHVCHVSTKKSVELIRKAKKDGVNVTAEATPHHLLLNCDAVLKYGTNAKMNPPLAYEEDRLACIDGLKDGTIDMIATDHAPHTSDEKAVSLEFAPFGIIGLETSFPILYTNLVLEGIIELNDLLKKMSLEPSRIFNLPGGKIAPGEPADLVIISLDELYKINPDDFYSRSTNTPFAGWQVQGRVIYTMVGGRIEYPG